MRNINQILTTFQSVNYRNKEISIKNGNSTCNCENDLFVAFIENKQQMFKKNVYKTKQKDSP